MLLGKGSVDSTLLMPAERFLFASMLALAAASLVVIGLRGTSVDWLSYAILLACTAPLMLIGLYYRASGRSEAMANSLIAAACFLLFSPVASAFTYQLLPVWRAPIDPWLVSMDAMLGFHWPDAMALAANHPWLGEVMRCAYMSWLPQFPLLIVALGFSGRTHELHVFMTATVIATLMTIAVWALFPSFGTSTVFELSAAVEAQLRPVVGSGYGAELRRLATEGPHLLSPKESLGLIAAPSFHTVMAVQAIFAAWAIRWLWLPALVINLLVLPSTVVHGGHHLVDVIAGVVTAYLGICAARLLLRSIQGTKSAAMSAIR
jgi:membrane-associated phospholipid phosphatase